MPITFDTLYDKMTLIRAGKREEIPFEIRTDPLTGTTGRVFELPYEPPKSPNTDETFTRSEGIFCPLLPGKYRKRHPTILRGIDSGGNDSEG